MLKNSIELPTFLNHFDKNYPQPPNQPNPLEQMAQTLFKSWFVDFDPVVDKRARCRFLSKDLGFSEELLHRVEVRKTVRVKVIILNRYQRIFGGYFLMRLKNV